MREAEEVIHDLKPLVSFWIVSTADINTALKLALRMVPQECENGDNRARGDVEGEFVFVNRELLNKLGETLRKVASVCVKRLGCFGVRGYRRIWGGRLRERRDGG